MTAAPVAQRDYAVDNEQNLLQNLSTAIVDCNSDFAIAFTNAAAQALFEFSESQAKGTSVLEFLKHQDMDNILRRCLDTLQSTTLRRIEIMSSGRQAKLVDCIVTALPSEDSNRLVLEINQVNTAVRQLEEDVMENGQQASSAVIRAIAHEIKNPLGGLRGAAQLLERELVKFPDLRVYTDIIVRETDRLCELVDDMSHSQSRIEPAPINIHEVLEHVYHLALAEVKDSLHIKRDYDPSLPPVLGDREQLIQAFVNMIRNAIEATAQSGQIILRTRVQRQVTFGKTRHMSAAKIEIEDNGCGISRELIDQIFYPMISGKAQGEGLGLSIVHQIIARHDGSITCDSQPGKTIFTVLLRFADANGLVNS